MSASREKKYRQGFATPETVGERERLEFEATAAKKKQMMIYKTIGGVSTVLLASLLVWNSGIFQKGVVAASIGSKDYTVNDVSYYYDSSRNYVLNMQEQYSSLYAQMGMDYTKFYDTARKPNQQMITEEIAYAVASLGFPAPEVGTTFHDYFSDQALQGMQYTLMMSTLAESEGYKLSDEASASLKETIATNKAYAQLSGYTYEGYLKAMYGSYMTSSMYENQLYMSALASEFEDHKMNSKEYTLDDYEAFYAESPGTLETYSYRLAFIAGTPAVAFDEDGNVAEASEDETALAMAEAEKAANGMVSLINSGLTFNEAASVSVAEVSRAQYADNSYNLVTDALGSAMASTAYGEWLTETAHSPNAIGVVEDGAGTGFYVVQYLNSELDTTALDSSEVRHILVMAETTETHVYGEDTVDEEGNVVAGEIIETTVEPTTEQMAAAKARINDIMDEFQSGEASPETFGELADLYSDDPGSNTTGGYYEVTPTSGFFDAFQNWALDPTNTVGDLTVIENPQDNQWGYHLMYLESQGLPTWQVTADNALRDNAYTTWHDSHIDNFDINPANGMSMLG